jgi:hypothetical protein
MSAFLSEHSSTAVVGPLFFAQYDAQAANAMSLSMGQLISSEAID